MTITAISPREQFALTTTELITSRPDLALSMPRSPASSSPTPPPNTWTEW